MSSLKIRRIDEKIIIGIDRGIDNNLIRNFRKIYIDSINYMSLIPYSIHEEHSGE